MASNTSTTIIVAAPSPMVSTSAGSLVAVVPPPVMVPSAPLSTTNNTHNNNTNTGSAPIATATSTIVKVASNPTSVSLANWFDRAGRLALAGGSAGAIAKTIVAPFERVKILCQTGETQGLLATYSRVLKDEGMRGFWRGNWANVIRIIPNKAVLFMCSDAFKDLLRSPTDVTLPAWKSVVSGSLSGASAVICTYPLDFVRGRVSGKVGSSNRYTGIVSTIRITMREEGFLALYRGMGPTLMGSFPYEGIKFGVYDTLKKRAPRDKDGKLSEIWKLTIGGAAGVAAGVVMFPNDTVRRRLQLQGQGGAPVLYTSGSDCYRKLIAQHGVTVLYRGLTANLIRVVPNAALQFWAYEALKIILGVNTRL